MSRKSSQPLPAGLIALLALGALPAHGLNSDPRQPIEIEAAKMVLDENQGISTYSGDVSLRQGSIHIDAERLVLYMQNKKLQRMEAFGSHRQPARFRQLTEQGEEAVGLAQQIEYDPQRSKLSLLDSAELIQGSNHIRSARIEYNTANNSLMAGPASPDTATRPDERVRIIIKPDNGQPPAREPAP